MSDRFRSNHWIPALFLVAQFVVAFVMFRNWANTTTYRLYLDRQISTAHSSATQQFEIEDQRVQPRIVMRESDRAVFSSQLRQDSTLRAEIRAERPVGYRISWRHDDMEQTLAMGVAEGQTLIASAIPVGDGVIELSSSGPATWVDPRIVRNPRIRKHGISLAALLVASFFWHRRARTPDSARSLTRHAYFRTGTVVTTLAMCCLLAEGLLRAAGGRGTAGIASERHDLGEITRDPRWEDTARYGRRLRANVDAVNEWRDGDIVRMGYIPPSDTAVLHRFSFLTDGEGFRNPLARDHFEIAALGDSFTDAMTMAGDDAWPARLERQLRVPVQNYGTAGFGPLQELLVLRDYIAPHRPSLVVLAFFAGNDIFDAEAFDAFARAGGRSTRPPPGWRIKDVVSRADTWFVGSALNAGVSGFRKAHVPERAATPVVGDDARTRVVASGLVEPFERGMFTLPVNGRVLRWALMPPYLNTLNFSERELRERRGWLLTLDALLDMQRAAHGFGAELIVMFLPTKSAVYWPVMEQGLSPERLSSALAFYLRESGRPVDLDVLRRNRLAQNQLLRDACQQAGIPFVDTTSALEERIAAGDNVYFPDDSHLNENGQSVITDALAAFLKEGSFLHDGRSH